MFVTGYVVIGGALTYIGLRSRKKKSSLDQAGTDEPSASLAEQAIQTATTFSQHAQTTLNQVKANVVEYASSETSPASTLTQSSAASSKTIGEKMSPTQSSSSFVESASTSEEIEQPKATIDKHALSHLKDKFIAPIFEKSQANQILGLSEAEDGDNSVEEQIDQNLAISLASLGIASVGTLFYPPLIILSLPGLIYTAVPFFQHAYETARDEQKVGIALVDSISIGGTLAGGYLVAGSLASSLVYFSQKVLIETQDRSRTSLVNVFGEQPRFVYIVYDDAEIEVAFEALEIDDVVVIDAGQTIPIDGTIVRGVGTVDERALTGESQPVEKEAGEQVLTSTILLAGRLYVTVEKTGQDTVAAKIGEVLSSTADFRSTVLSRGQKIVDQGAIPTLALSALALPAIGRPECASCSVFELWLPYADRSSAGCPQLFAHHIGTRDSCQRWARP